MRTRSLLLTLGLLAAVAAPRLARAQDTTFAVRPGMSETDVRQRWGEPVAVRRLNDWTYMFYENGMERHLGYYDTVFLQGGAVVDAIVRAEGRMYMGQSSSPEGRAPVFTPPRQPGQPADTTRPPAEVGGVRVTPPRPER